MKTQGEIEAAISAAMGRFDFTLAQSPIFRETKKS